MTSEGAWKKRVDRRLSHVERRLSHLELDVATLKNDVAWIRRLGAAMLPLQLGTIAAVLRG